MGYLSNENNAIIVDAILTKYGREKLASEGNLGVTKFALADDEVDYALYNTDHPLGSDYYDIAIRQMPVLEALPSNDLTMKYKLFTVRDDTVSTVYVLNVSYPTEFDAGTKISKTDIGYQFTPYTTPGVADNTKIFYIAELVDTFRQAIKIEPIIDPQIGLTNALAQEAETYANQETDTRKFAVGHSFKFTVNRLPSTDRVFTINITAGGEYSVRGTSINVNVMNATSAASL